MATDDGRHPRLGMRTPFTRPPRNRSWRPSSHDVSSHVGRSEEATRVSEASGIDRRRRKTTPSSQIARAPKWEARREARFPPASFASDGPEPEDACVARLRSGGAAREWTSAWSSTEPKGSGTRATLVQRRKASPELAAALGGDEVRVLEWETVSGCRSRSDASLVATPVGANCVTTDTRDLARRNRWGSTRHQRGERANRVRGRTRCLSNTEMTSFVQAARASLVGIASGGVRARGLGKSKGRERATADTTEGVRIVDASP